MLFVFGPVSIELKKKKNDIPELSLSDVKELNDDTISYLRGLSNDELRRRVDSVTVSDLSDVNYVGELLDKDGIVVVPNFFPKGAVDSVSDVVGDIIKEIELFSRSGKVVEESEKILFQKGSAKLSGYSRLSGYDKAVVQIREGQDEGMVDIFNVDFAYPKLSELRKAYDESNILKILSGSANGVRFKNLNFYLNYGVVATRGFHADSYSSQLKAFIYLSDCLELDDGPYTYVAGSHKDSAYRRFNRAASAGLPNNTESPFVKRENIVPVLAGKGALVISDQSGFHRGFPQGVGHSRVISVMNIK